ncbi:MAG TPA: surface-adhesin E family protein [Steroidobacteraceae bacterium]
MAARNLMRHFGGARLLALLLGVIAPVPSFAAHWIYIGKSSDSADRIMLDTDSLKKDGQFTFVDILTVYATPRMNSYDITMDRFMQRTAFDCKGHTFVAVETIGYLQGKRVGTSHATVDWKDETVPIPSDPLSDRIYAAVCTPAAQR